MNVGAVQVEQIERVTEEGETEQLRFEPGLNTLVGRPNTGKTIWLTMLDYALGDRSSVEKSLSVELAEKYSIIRVVLRLGNDDQTVVERRWKEPGSKHKVYVDDHPLSVSDFSSYFLPKLGIPVLHYPQGDPYSSRAWPELSWRSLFRHVYRRQDIGWGGIVERQPESEQHACILQFLGIAEHIYSDEYGNLVNLRKARNALKARRDNYLTTLNEISRDLLEMDAAPELTSDAIEEALLVIRKAIDDLRERKNAAHEATLEQRSQESAAFLSRKAVERAELINQQSEIVEELREAERRFVSIRDYLGKVDHERKRLERVQVPGELFSDLRITNCPACDQSIRGSNDEAKSCFLCKRMLPASNANMEMARERVSVEILQLREESRESKQLGDDLKRRIEVLSRRLRLTGERLSEVEFDIERAREPASTTYLQEVSQIDVKIGRLDERRKQWARIASALNERELISKEIQDLQSTIADLDDAVEKSNALVDFSTASSALAKGMNEYLRLLNSFRKNAWSQSDIALSLRERQFRFTVGGEPWATRLGGTLTLYFLLAYQYGLLKLSNTAPYKYPGFTVLDMPAELPDIEVSDLENFAIEPFAKLLEMHNMAGCQVIVAGSSFKDLSGANKIDLTHVFS
ncbi:MAG: hypothetical protein OXI35_02835 [Gemmatimonadota bacterium]|nr:hypothetical protein [Gemmatimonadota bacterium]